MMRLGRKLGMFFATLTTTAAMAGTVVYADDAGAGVPVSEPAAESVPTTESTPAAAAQYVDPAPATIQEAQVQAETFTKERAMEAHVTSTCEEMAPP